MSNLENLNNIYANLAESAYNGRPKNFPTKANTKKEKYINYSKDALNNKGKIQIHGGTNLPNNGVVYL